MQNDTNKTEKALVTVVIPVYNVEKYLDRCINSVVNQTYTNLEIILVDDGSPDRCTRYLRVWAKRDARIKVIHKKNEGLGYARNTGIDHALGEYICFVDSDDYIALDLVEKTYSAAKEKMWILCCMAFLKSIKPVRFAERFVQSQTNAIMKGMRSCPMCSPICLQKAKPTFL